MRAQIPRVKGPSHSFTVNKRCLKSCLVFCSYGCYSSGRLLPGPGPFQVLWCQLFRDRTWLQDYGLGPCLLAPPTPVLQGPKAPLPMPTPCQDGKLCHAS